MNERLTRAGVVLAALLALALSPAVAGAQFGVRMTVGASAATTELERTGAPALGGLVTGAYGRIAFRAVALEVGYAQGTLEADGSSSASEDLVDGEVMLAVRVLPWLQARAGQHLRAFVTPAGTERWSRMELRLQADAELVPGMMRADAEVATALAAEVNTVSTAGSAHGVTVGVTLRVANSPVDLRLSYAADRASTSDANVEFLQTVGLRVTVGRR